MNAEDQVSVTLTATQWNAILMMLSEQPFKLSAPMIGAIQAQCAQHEAGGNHPQLRSVE